MMSQRKARPLCPAFIPRGLIDDDPDGTMRPMGSRVLAKLARRRSYAISPNEALKPKDANGAAKG